MTQILSQNNHFFYLAPIRGVTDALYRNVYHSHFPYFDAALAPFINPQRYANFKARLLADVLPDNNTTLPIVPQLLNNNAMDFYGLGKRLQDLGYCHINWNLGCPAPMVANKKRGSGLLPHADEIIALLQEVTVKLDCEISIKTRLGYRDPGEIEILLPQLEEIELKEIVIHPRIGKQLYRGHADPDGFARCKMISSHRLVYNGDINTPKDFLTLSKRFPEINRWMIGRGAIADPFLLATIRGLTIPEQQKREKLRDFHTDLYDHLKIRLSGHSHLLGRMKQIWAYFIESFPTKKKVLKKIRKASTEIKYKKAMDELFGDQ